MSERLSWLNALPDLEAQAELLRCCGSIRWARQVAQARPFASFEELLEVADGMWWSLDAEDWLEAFRAHPRIGEKKPAAGEPAGTERWSAQEQSGMQRSRDEVRAALARGNQEYEERFGHIFLVCATGKSGEGMLALLQERLGNDPETELRVAAEEQRKITHLRLEKLLQS
ncbi:MAG TPA: 2-oxo-4-hydroxy-4-carboxy-5-ureidoimidazoline decarboxylase [Longimicrobiaceae bacterium]|nr:2-oxo-4-hydroxy-4-carboxy-5-ureidoimidazoline decarboxylase [Longimicrobiaceae bacterium]